MFRLTLALIATAAVAQDTHVILLGTGTPNPDPERFPPAVVIVSGGRPYLVDCGEGVIRRAVQARLDPNSLTRVFFTHLHSDHTTGYPDLILMPPNTGRTVPVEAWGPPGLRALTKHILAGWREDLNIRLHGLQPGVVASFNAIAHDVRPGEVYHDENVRVTAFAVPHGTWKYAYGYRFAAKDKTIVISGDTTYSEGLIAAAKGCDILIHEVISAAGLAKRTPDWQKYHSTFHTTAIDVGRVAAAVRPRVLVLYHIISMGESEAEVLGEVRRNWGGEVVYGRDLDVIR
jgi:ribonuclease Z